MNILSRHPASNISDNLCHPAGNVQQHEPRGGLQGSVVLYSTWECDFLCHKRFVSKLILDALASLDFKLSQTESVSYPYFLRLSVNQVLQVIQAIQVIKVIQVTYLIHFIQVMQAIQIMH